MSQTHKHLDTYELSSEQMAAVPIDQTVLDVQALLSPGEVFQAVTNDLADLCLRITDGLSQLQEWESRIKDETAHKRESARAVGETLSENVSSSQGFIGSFIGHVHKADQEVDCQDKE